MKSALLSLLGLSMATRQSRDDDDNAEALAAYQSVIYNNNRLFASLTAVEDDDSKKDEPPLNDHPMETFLHGFIREQLCIYIPTDILTLLLKYFPPKYFKYNSDFDTNGLIHFLGFVEAKTSSKLWDASEIKKLTQDNCRDLFADDSSDAWIMINLGNIKMKLTAYTLRNHTSTHYMLESWRLEGSHNGKKWIIIKDHVSDMSLGRVGHSYTWSLDTDQYFSYFRIYQSESTYGKSSFLCLGGIEFYGTAYNIGHVKSDDFL